MIDWVDFLARARPDTDFGAAGLVLCLDPGETTGWAVFRKGELAGAGQILTGADPALMAQFIRDEHEGWYDSLEETFDHIVYEEYRIRSTKARQHIGSEVWTIQHIGAIRATATELDIPVTKQSAGMAKGFATDRKLRQWGLYQTNMRHANDAVRHGVYWHLFYFGRAKPGRAR